MITGHIVGNQVMDAFHHLVIFGVGVCVGLICVAAFFVSNRSR